MHIDQSKLVELLAETSGIEKDTAEKYLRELVSEIKDALEEGEAYELDGFGVFSQIGENTLFIPTEDLATEINYKYAGMTPILLDDDGDKSDPEAVAEDDADEDPFSGLLDDIAEPEQGPETISGESDDIDTSGADDLSDPFTFDYEGSVDEEETPGEETEEEEFTEIPNEVDYNPDRTDDESRILFSGLLEVDEEEGDDDDEPSGSEEFSDNLNEPDLQPDPAFSELNTDVDEEEAEDDPFDLDDNNDDILSDEMEGVEAQDEEPKLVSEDDTDKTQEEEVKAQDGGADKDIEVSESPDEMSGEEEIEEDPFETLAGDFEDEDLDIEEEEEDIFAAEIEEPEDTVEEKESQEEVVPVIKNVASEKKRNKKKPARPNKEKKSKKPSKPASKAPVPVFLWVVLFIVIIGGGVYGLGYFGLINIPGITPQAGSSQQITAQQSEQAEPETPLKQTQQEGTGAEQPATEDPGSAQPEQTEPAEETTGETQPPAQETTVENESTIEAVPPEGQAEYGMDGVPVESANDGYTIVVFSLSNQESAAAKKDELESAGYRVLLAEIPSQQYGSLWRVSLGQFDSMRDAAIAAEDLDASLSENYFITKIQ